MLAAGCFGKQLEIFDVLHDPCIRAYEAADCSYETHILILFQFSFPSELRPRRIYHWGDYFGSYRCDTEYRCGVAVKMPTPDELECSVVDHLAHEVEVERI